MIERKCKHCGGTIRDNKCLYCRSEYEPEPKNEYEAILIMNGERIYGYAIDIQYTQQELDCYRNAKGYLVRNVKKQKRIVTFMEK